MCCTWLAGNTRRKNSPKIANLRPIAQLCRAISSQLSHVSTIGRKFLNTNTSSTCLHNMVNFGPLTAEISWRVWGTPANFNGFRVLVSLSPVYTIQPVVKPVVYPVWQPVVSCKRDIKLTAPTLLNGGQPNFALNIHFRGSCPLTEFCQSCVLLHWQH